MMKFLGFLKKLNNSKNNEKGSALITVLLMLLIFSVLASSVMLTTMNNFYVAQRMSEYEDTYYIAEAGAQHALEFIKQKTTLYYIDYYETGIQDPFFLDKLTSAITTINEDDSENIYCLYIPMDFSDDDVIVTTTIEKMPTEVPLPDGNDGASMVYTYQVSCNAKSINSGSERTIIGEISVSNPRIDSKMTTSPPVVESRLTVGQQIMSENQNYWFSSGLNALLCYSDVYAGQAFSIIFKNNHGTDAFSFYNYRIDNNVPDWLEWDLTYNNFPTHVAFDDYEALYEKSRGLDYDLYSGDPIFSDGYNIQRCEPGYTITEFDQADARNLRNGANFNGDGQPLEDNNNFDIGVDNIIQKLYIDGEVDISGTRNMKNVYYYANGDININITGTMENCILITNSNITVTCSRIINDDNLHKMFKANGNVTINIDDSNTTFVRQDNYNLENLVVYSEQGEIKINDTNTSNVNRYTRNNEEIMTWHGGWLGSYLYLSTENVTYNRKIGADNCYFYTNKNISNASMGFTNVRFHNSFVNSGKDLVLRDCSGDSSYFYAHGTDLADTVHNNNWSSYNSQVNNLIYNDYNYGESNYSLHFTYGNYHYVKNRTGISLQSNTRSLDSGYTSYYEECVYNDCDFTSGAYIHVGLVNTYENANYEERVKASNSRFIANKEAFFECADFDTCYIFAGIEGYNSSTEPSAVYKNVNHGITLKCMEPYDIWASIWATILSWFGISMDQHSRMTFNDTVMYSRGRILYINDQKEPLSTSADENSVKQFYNCLLYSIDNFEYNGSVFKKSAIHSASDVNFQSSYRDLFNDVIIMTESNIRPQSGFGEFSFFGLFDTDSDFMIIGGDLTSNAATNTRGVAPQIEGLIGENKTGKGKYRNIEVKADILYDNYFEQTSADTIKDLPKFEDVFVYEDIYEKKKVDSPYD